MEVVSKPTGEGAPGSGDGPGGVMASPSLTRLTRGSASPQRVSAQRDVYVSQARRALPHASRRRAHPSSLQLRAHPSLQLRAPSLQPRATRPLALQPATACMQPRNRLHPVRNRMQPAHSPHACWSRACSRTLLPCSYPAAHAELDDAAHQDALRLRRHAGGQAADDQPAAQPHARLRRGRHARAPPDALLGQQPRAAAGCRGAEPLGGGGQRARRAQALAQPLAGPDLQRWRVRQQAQSTPSDPPWHEHPALARGRARLPRLPGGVPAGPGAARHPWPSRHCLRWPSRHCLRWPSRHCLWCRSRTPLQPPTPRLPLAPAGGACDAGSSRSEAPRPSAPIARPRVRPPTWATTRADAHLTSCRGGRGPTRC